MERFFLVAQCAAGAKARWPRPRPLPACRRRDPASSVPLTTIAKQSFATRTIAPGVVDHLAHRRPLVADDHRVGDDRAEPVEEVEHLRSADAGKQVFVAAGKPDHLVRENRPDDDDLVVVEEPAVDLHFHVEREQAAGQRAGLPGGNRTDRLERRRVVPLVVEQPRAAVFRLPLVGGDLQPRAHRLLAHGRVRAEREHDIARLANRADLSVHGFKEQTHRRGAGGVGYDQQDASVRCNPPPGKPARRPRAP